MCFSIEYSHYIQIFQISKIWGFHVGQFWWNLDFLEFVHGGCFPEIQNSCDVPFPILCEDLPDLINPSVPMDLKIDFTFFPVSRFYRFPWLSSHVHRLFSLWTQWSYERENVLISSSKQEEPPDLIRFKGLQIHWMQKVGHATGKIL